MSIKKSEKDFLVETLVEAGVSRTVARNATIMNWAKDDLQENKRVHTATNTLLLDLLRKDDLGTCIHVTGSATALTDPFHRQVCEAMQMDNKDPFQVIYYLPQEVKRDGWGLVEWNLGKWKGKNFSDWRQKLRTLRMIGNRAVDLKSYDERSKIQFSVFGHRYIQVQSKHTDEAKSKYVWLIKSEQAHEQLANSAQSDLSKSDEVDESVFTSMVTTVFSNSARAMLHMVAEGETTSSDDIVNDKFLHMIDPSPRSTLEALKVMSFLNSGPQGELNLTNDGAAFLKSS